MSSSVVMEESMEKNSTIETCFERYFAGAPLPPCDLSEAKRVVSARARGRVRKIIAAAVSSAAVACIGILVGLAFLVKSLFGDWWGNMLPDAPQGYLLADMSATSASFSQLNGKYDIMHSFAPFSLADNADAEYTIYAADDKEILLRADLRYTDGMTSFRATVWCDLTEGEYSVKDFEDYRALIPQGETYGHETEYINGEYVSRACMMKKDTEYVIDMTSPNRGALDMLVSMLKK